MNYTEIVDASKAYADRYDTEVANTIEVFIIMAESRINRVLKTRRQTTRAYLPTQDDAEYYSMPRDYAGMRDIQLNSGIPGEPENKASNLEYISPHQFNVQRGKSFGGTNYYTIIADQIQVFPVQPAGKTIEIVYYRRVPHLESTSPENWLSDVHPDIYISGIIAEIEAFVKNYDVSKAWDDRMSRAINELENSDVEERWAGQPLRVRIG